MTVLTAIRSAVLRATGTQINEAFTSAQKVAVEMVDLVNEAAEDIARSNDWRALTKIATLAGGSESYTLPSDYDRMSGEVDDPSLWPWGYAPFQSVTEWQRYRNGLLPISSPGGWIIVGGEILFWPVEGGGATFPYISNLWAVTPSSAPAAAFTTDNDRFVLDEGLLTLALVWRWRQQKRMEYAEDMQSYEIALARAAGRDRGSYVLRPGMQSRLSGSTPYTGRIF